MSANSHQSTRSKFYLTSTPMTFLLPCDNANAANADAVGFIWLVAGLSLWSVLSVGRLRANKIYTAIVGRSDRICRDFCPIATGKFCLCDLARC